ncbi:hypothetical protein U879_05725 [Defluviimonas sp. 20V17]|uniref:DUF6456 domain-containing protein n=1 Tax=Allgaiera indica TaxID=765699 RepID=A0AAN4UTA5_9RHOB|nr:DUF6456 domain-containing protein [Allgaiera indica]KDB04638.1 hypothetical protein U879_05725 [Defluviimonas sp. 20V17]GHE03736.1 hypothetical protein GCM10008024_28280 [Allgaiera indica]SDX73681.1 hypothetical protein SAMN05444006_1279 [Allgaiera indica]
MPALTPDFISPYLRHTLHGETIRGVARDMGVDPSTISRRVRRVEDMIDCPIWAYILEAIAADAAQTRDPGTRYSLADLLRHLGTSAEEVDAAARKMASTPRRSRKRALILIGADMERAAIMAGDVVMGSLGRPAVLGMLLSGKAEIHSKIGRVACLRYVETEAHAPIPDPEENPAPRVRYSAPLPLVATVETAARRSASPINAGHLRIARAMAEAAEIDPESFRGTLNSLGLGPDLTAILRTLTLDGLGFQEAEKALEWPARSAKLVCAIALDLAAARGFAA